MRYTQEQYQRACTIDLAAYLTSRGYAVKRSGSEAEILNPRGVTVRGSQWFDHYAGEGGGSIQFLVRYEGMGWTEAVLELAGAGVGHEERESEKGKVWQDARKDDLKTPPFLQTSTRQDKVPFVLPAGAPDNRRAFAYLHKTRGVDAEIVRYCLENRSVYESLELNAKTGKTYHNCVFVGCDKSGEARYATMRGMNSVEAAPFRHDVAGSAKNIPFRFEGTSRNVYVYEAPIDLLSHASILKQTPHTSMTWKEEHRVALSGVYDGGLKWYLAHKPGIERVTFCLDRDETGLKAAANYMEKYASQGYEVGCLLPMYKDWNEDLLRGAHTQEAALTSEPSLPCGDSMEAGG